MELLCNLILERYQEILDEYNKEEESLKEFENREDKKIVLKIHNDTWKSLIASLPCGFVLGVTMITNYRQLKIIYNQRKNHKLTEWHEFCAWCETLLHFKEIYLKEE